MAIINIMLWMSIIAYLFSDFPLMTWAASPVHRRSSYPYHVFNTLGWINTNDGVDNPVVDVNKDSNCTNDLNIITSDTDNDITNVNVNVDNQINNSKDAQVDFDMMISGNSTNVVVNNDEVLSSQANDSSTSVESANTEKEDNSSTDINISNTYTFRTVELMSKYKGKFIHCISSSHNQNCDIYLCGTLHVAKISVDMVKEVIQSIQPNYVVLEVCDARLDSLIDNSDVEMQNLTLSQVFQATFQEKSIKTFGMGLLTWMQLKAAKLVGNKLGGELAMAAKEGARQGAVLVLGDRQYGVTIQRLFDRLSWTEKLKIGSVLIWEVLTMSFLKIKEYIRLTESSESFVNDELIKFSKLFPTFADVIINERDEYLCQTLCEIARVGFRPGQCQPQQRGCIVAVVGAGHLPGIQRWMAAGGIAADRIMDISKSSKHLTSTWPGAGILQIVNPKTMFPDI